MTRWFELLETTTKSLQRQITGLKRSQRNTLDFGIEISFGEIYSISIELRPQPRQLSCVCVVAGFTLCRVLLWWTYIDIVYAVAYSCMRYAILSDCMFSNGTVCVRAPAWVRTYMVSGASWNLKSNNNLSFKVNTIILYRLNISSYWLEIEAWICVCVCV